VAITQVRTHALIPIVAIRHKYVLFAHSQLTMTRCFGAAQGCNFCDYSCHYIGLGITSTCRTRNLRTLLHYFTNLDLTKTA
jgi:hypothetical protein